jgi:hypothetical protein
MTDQFKKKAVQFTLRDIGSEIIDQLSSDIYSGPKQIMRELVKNAYDAYLAVDPDELEDEKVEREIVISRERNERGIGRLLIADSGIGLTVDELKAFVQISLCKKQEELTNATGFRGLGSWSTIGAGSKIIVTSNKKNHSSEAQLVIDVREIYSIMGPATTLEDILNNSKCISFGERTSTGLSQGTTVEVICDGPPKSVNGHELNRLYDYTDPDSDLKSIIVESCPIPFSSEGGAYKIIHDICREAGYVLTHISLDGDPLERGLPDDLPEPIVHPIMVGRQVVAKAWVTTSSKYSGEVRTIDEDRHLLGGKGLQLKKLNVPIGPKNIYSNGVVRATLPNWYVGEIHILADDIRPDASGQDLRAGTARETFIAALQGFYKQLEQQGERKSDVISMERKFRQAIGAAEKLKSGGLSATERIQTESQIATAVQLIEEASKRTKATTKLEERQREAAKDPKVEPIRKQARKILKEAKLLDKYTSSKKRTIKEKRKAGSAVSESKQKVQVISFNDIQARLGRAVPRLAQIGLTSDEIEQILEIISDLILGDG